MLLLYLVAYIFPSMQVATLSEAHKLHPNANWWIKGDGCDVISGLEESLRLEWHGDVDFGTGELERLYEAYQSRLKKMDVLKLNALLKENTVKILLLLSVEQEQVKSDIKFLAEGL